MYHGVVHRNVAKLERLHTSPVTLCMLFGPTQPDLANPTPEERRMIEDAKARIAAQKPSQPDVAEGAFTVRGTLFAAATLASIAFATAYLLRWLVS